MDNRNIGTQEYTGLRNMDNRNIGTKFKMDKYG